MFTVGNTHGRGRPKKGNEAAAYIRKHLKDEDLASKLASLVSTGDPAAIKLACEYLWGKPVQRNENENTHIFPTKLTIEFEEDPKSDKYASL